MPTSIDTNIFIALLIPPVSQQDERHQRKATELLQTVSDGSGRAIISEIVLHESYYVLVTRRKVLSISSFCDAFRDILSWPGWLVDGTEMEIWFRALDIVEQYPKLEFSDAVIAARAEAHNADLATFDRRLAEAFGGPIWADS